MTVAYGAGNAGGYAGPAPSFRGEGTRDGWRLRTLVVRGIRRCQPPSPPPLPPPFLTSPPISGGKAAAADACGRILAKTKAQAFRAECERAWPRRDAERLDSLRMLAAAASTPPTSLKWPWR